MTDKDAHARDVLAEFVIWRLRERDLPPDVAAAAERLAPDYPRPPTMGGYLEAAFSVSGVDRVEEGRVTPWLRCFGRHDALNHADQLIVDGFDYVLIDRQSQS